MTYKDNKTDWIDRYLNGKLTEKELKEFEQQLLQDEDLLLDVQAHKAVLQEINKLGEKELKTKLKLFHAGMLKESQEQPPDSRLKQKYIKESEDNNPKSIWNSKIFMAVAASVFLLIAAGVILWMYRYSGTGKSSDQAFSGQVFRVAVIEKGGESLGYAGQGVLTDSVIVMLVNSSKYPNHYQFQDTLKIFSSGTGLSPSGFSLVYNSKSNIYRLQVDDKLYDIERGFNTIHELVEAETQ